MKRQFILAAGKGETWEQISMSHLQKALANTLIWKTSKTN